MPHGGAQFWGGGEVFWRDVGSHDDHIGVQPFGHECGSRRYRGNAVIPHSHQPRGDIWMQGMGGKDHRHLSLGPVTGDQALPIAFSTLQMRIHQGLRQIGIPAHQGFIDLDVISVGFSAPVGITEIDRQALLAYRIINAAHPVKQRVLGGAHDFQMKITVFFGDGFAS